MTTKFNYWFQSGATAPLFTDKDTPKAYLEQWFFQKDKNSPPLLDEDSVGIAELLHAGLSAGYGKRSSWSGSLLLGKDERAQLYRYMRTRLEATYECLDIDGSGISLKPLWRGIEPSEKAALSFAIGSVGAYIGASRWLAQYPGAPSIKRFLHARLFTDASIVQTPLGLENPDGDSVPDFLLEDSAGNWHIFEAKGGDQGNRWRQIIQGLSQTKRVKQVGPLGALTVPASAVCVHTLVARGTRLELVLVDPPPDTEDHAPTQPGDVSISFISELLDLSSILDAIDWFHCLNDAQMAGATSVTTQAVEDVNEGWSRAFGGVNLAVPKEYIELEEDVRLATQLLTVFTHLLTFSATNVASIEAPDIASRAAELVQVWERHHSSLAAKLGLTAPPFEYSVETFRQIAAAADKAGPTGRRHPVQQIVENLEVNGRKIPELVALLTKSTERLRSQQQSEPDGVENKRSAASVERDGLVMHMNNPLSREL